MKKIVNMILVGAHIFLNASNECQHPNLTLSRYNLNNIYSQTNPYATDLWCFAGKKFAVTHVCERVSRHYGETRGALKVAFVRPEKNGDIVSAFVIMGGKKIGDVQINNASNVIETFEPVDWFKDEVLIDYWPKDIKYPEIATFEEELAALVDDFKSGNVVDEEEYCFLVQQLRLKYKK